jgi:TP901 family phage tail tape measure protein
MATEREVDRLVVRLMGDATSYKAMMKEAQRITREASKVMGEIGSNLTKYVTVPLVAMGAAAVKTFTDFEHSLSQIEGLVGLSSETVAGFREEILKLSPAVGKGPAELSEAMFFITSAGLRGKDALEALNASARASAAGLGETKSVADAVTSAMNAYGIQNVSATRATEILTAAVREGKAEASSFAPVLGQVLPTANELGVSFDQAAGAIAFLTKSTGSASLAATGLRGILAQIIRPTSDAQKALAEAGMSVEQLRDSIKQRGLQATLVDLRNAFDAQGIPISRMFADIEGLNAVLQLTGPQAADAAKVIESVGKSAGIVDDAFAATQKTIKQQFNQAMADVQVALIRVGEELQKTLIPALQKAQQFIERGTAAWQRLTPEQKEAVVQFGFVAAAIGPVLKALSLLRVALVSTGVGAIVVGLGLLAAAFLQNEAAMKKVKEILEPFREVWDEMKSLWIELQPMIEEVARVIAKDLKSAFEAMVPLIKVTVGILAEYIKTVLKAISATVEFVERAAKIAGNAGNAASNPIGYLMDKTKKETNTEPGILSQAGGNIGGGLAGLIGKSNLAEARRQVEETKAARDESAKIAAETEAAKRKSLGVERELNAMMAQQTEEQKKAVAEAKKLEAERQKAIGDTIKALQKEVATYGMSRKELALYEAAQMGASEAQRSVIAALQDELGAKENAIKATEDAKRATDEAREAEKRFRESFKTGAIEGVGAGFDALARLLDSRNMRAAGRNSGATSSVVSNFNPANLMSNPNFVANINANANKLEERRILERIAESTEATAQKEPIQIKSAGIGGS